MVRHWQRRCFIFLLNYRRGKKWILLCLWAQRCARLSFRRTLVRLVTKKKSESRISISKERHSSPLLSLNCCILTREFFILLVLLSKAVLIPVICPVILFRPRILLHCSPRPAICIWELYSGPITGKIQKRMLSGPSWASNAATDSRWKQVRS